MFARALGIDPGLVRTGWAVVESLGRQPSVLGHGVIAPPTDADLAARLAHGARQLREVVAEYRPDFVALEEIFTAPRHPRSALLMAHMRGAICLVLEEAGIPIVPLTATTVKQRLTSGGHASKEQVQRMVLRLTGFQPVGRMKLDETDAIALALAALHQRSEVRGSRFEEYRSAGSPSHLAPHLEPRTSHPAPHLEPRTSHPAPHLEPRTSHPAPHV